MPWTDLAVMTATGSPGIRRGKMKFRMKAKTRVTRNQSSLLRKYFRYPFNATPPRKYNRHYTNKVTVTWSDQISICGFRDLPIGRKVTVTCLLQEQPCPGWRNMAVLTRLRFT